MVATETKSFIIASLALLIASIFFGVLVNLQGISNQIYTITRAFGFGFSIWIAPLPLVIILALLFRFRAERLSLLTIAWWVLSITLAAMIAVSRFLI